MKFKKEIWIMISILLLYIVLASFPYPDQMYNFYNAQDPNPFNASNILHLDNNTGTGIIDSANWSGNLRRNDGVVVNIEDTDWKNINTTNERFNYAIALNNESRDEAIILNISFNMCEGWAFSTWITSRENWLTTATLLGANGATTDFFFNFRPLGGGGEMGQLDIELGTSDGGQRITDAFLGVGGILNNTKPQHLFLMKSPGCSVGNNGLQLFINGTNYTSRTWGLNQTLLNNSFNAGRRPFIGARNQGDALLGFNGTFDDIMFWYGEKIEPELTNGLLAKVLTIYNGNYTNSTVPDTTPPNITLINFTSDGGTACPNVTAGAFNNCGNTSDGTPTFNIVTTENAVVQINLTDTNFVDFARNCTPSDFTSSSLTCTYPTNLDEGRYVFFFPNRDSLGNNQSSPLPDHFKANLTINFAPNVNFTSNTTPDGNLTVGYIFANITTNDTLGVRNTSLFLYNGSVLVRFNTTLTDFQFSSLFTNFTDGIADGNYTLNASSEDIANRRNATASRDIRIDRTAPSIDYSSLTSSDNTNTTSPYINVSSTIRDIRMNNATVRLFNETAQINATTFYITSNISINWSLADGLYTFSVESYDTFGNGNITSNRTVRIDTVAPLIDFNEPTTPAGNLTLRFIYANITSNDSVFLNSITLWLWNFSEVRNSSVNFTSPFFKNFTDLPDGNYTLNASSYDTSGNANRTASRSITLDATLCNIDYGMPTSPNNQNTTSPYINISVTASDVHLENLSIALYNATALLNNSMRVASNFSINWTLAEGVYDFNATCYDTFEQLNSTSTRQVSIDFTAPSINFSEPSTSSGNLTQNFIYANFSSNETVSIVYHNITLYNVSNQFTNFNCGTLVCFNNFTSLEDGNYTINATISDNHGNRNRSHSRDFSIDLTAPSVDFGQPTSANGSNTSSQYINVSITLNDIRINNVSVILINSTSEANSTTRFTANVSINWTLGEGKWSFRVLSYDTFRNQNETETRNVTIDLTDPTANFTSNTTLDESNLTVNFIYANISGNDTINVKNISLFLFNSSGLTNQSTHITLPGFTFASIFENWTSLQEGNYTLNASLEDFSGRINRTPSRNIRIDLTAPLIDFGMPTTDNNSNITSPYVNVSSSVRDIRMNNHSILLWNFTDFVNITTRTTSNISINFTLSDGIWTFNVTSYDVFHNRNSSETRTVRIDMTAPSINFSEPSTSSGNLTRNFIYANLSSNETLSIVYLNITLYNTSNQFINFNCGTLVCFNNFTSLEDGNYTINATISDNHGNRNRSHSRNFSIDLTIPNVIFTGQTDSAGTRSFPYINITVNANDVHFNNLTIFLYYSNGSFINSTTTSNQGLSINTSLADATYNFNATSYDTFGNRNSTATRAITIGEAEAGAGGGGGGGVSPIKPAEVVDYEIKTCGEGLILVNDSCVPEKKEINYLLWFLISAVILTLAFFSVFSYFVLFLAERGKN